MCLGTILQTTSDCPWDTEQVLDAVWQRGEMCPCPCFTSQLGSPGREESAEHCPSHSTIFCHASIPSPAMGKTLEDLQCPCPHQETLH